MVEIGVGAAERRYKAPRNGTTYLPRKLWVPLPVGLGALLLGAIQYKRQYLTNQPYDGHDTGEETVTLRHP